jgi:hypothetical protein
MWFVFASPRYAGAWQAEDTVCLLFERCLQRELWQVRKPGRCAINYMYNAKSRLASFGAYSLHDIGVVLK